MKWLLLILVVACVVIYIEHPTFWSKRCQVKKWVTKTLVGTAQAGFQNEAPPELQPPSMWRSFTGRLYKNLKSPMHIDLKVLACDLDTLKAMNGNSYRFSVEWARVQRDPGSWDTSYYHGVCRLLRERALRPVITLFHFVLPPWAEHNWEKGQNYFVTFGKRIMDEFKCYSPVWVTLNEPYLYALHSYMIGARPPFRKKPRRGMSVLCNMLTDHVELYRYGKDVCPHCPIGIAKNFMPVHAKSSMNPIDQAARFHFNAWFNESFLTFLRTGVIRMFFMGACAYTTTGMSAVADFVGVNHYTEISFATSFSLSRPIDVLLRPPRSVHRTALSEAGWIVTANSWITTLEMIVKHVPDMPIIVTECGVSNLKHNSSLNRSEAMANILTAINLFPQVKGVLVWTLVSNIEWESGDKVDFGVIGHDRSRSEIYDVCARHFELMTSP